MSRIGSALSCVLLVHAGFSTIHYKTIAPHEALPPTDVVVEVLVACFLALLTSVMAMPEFKKVRLADIKLLPDQVDVAFHCPDFMVFAHRGRSVARRRSRLSSRSSSS